MSKLSDLFNSAAQSRKQRRATQLAKADYRLLASLVSVRKARRMTQQDVADKLGLTQPTIAAFESYDADPKLSTVRRYAHAVGAAVTHNVALDDGQLDEVADWSASTFTVTVVPSYRARTSSRADFALAG